MTTTPAADFLVSVIRDDDGALPEAGCETIRFASGEYHLDLPELLASWLGLRLLVAASRGVDAMERAVTEAQAMLGVEAGDEELDEWLSAAGVAVLAERDTRRVRVRTERWTLHVDSTDAGRIGVGLIALAGRVGRERQAKRN